jgi:hypothetical protein
MSSFFVVIEKRRRRGGGGGGGVHKLDERDARDSPKLLNVAAWQKLGSKILLRFPLVLGRREAGFDCPDIWHSPIPEWQLAEICWQRIYFISSLLIQASKQCPNNCLTLVNPPLLLACVLLQLDLITSRSRSDEEEEEEDVFICFYLHLIFSTFFCSSSGAGCSGWLSGLHDAGGPIPGTGRTYNGNGSAQ